MESRVQDAAVAALPADFIRDPYPYFAQKRGEGGVWTLTAGTASDPFLCGTPVAATG